MMDTNIVRSLHIYKYIAVFEYNILYRHIKQLCTIHDVLRAC